MKNMRMFKYQKGFSVIEVILAASVFALLITIFVGAFLFGQESSLLSGKRNRGLFLAEEGLEAVRNIREGSFSNLLEGTFGLTNSNNIWMFSGSQDTTDIFRRAITISSVGTNTKQVISNVSWQQTPQRFATISLSTYLTNWTPFVSKIGDWRNSSQEASLNFRGRDNAWKVQTLGDYAYSISYTGDSDFAVIDISTTTPTISSTLSLKGDLRNIALENFVYLATSSDDSELEIVDISTPDSPSSIGIFDASGKADAQGIFANNSMVYLVRNSSEDDEFLIIKTSNPSSPSLIGSLDLEATGYEVFVSGNFAYLASDSDTQELMVIDISIPDSPSLAGSLNLVGNADGLSITGFANTIILGRSNGYLHIIDVSIPSSPILSKTFNAQSRINDISLGINNNYAFISTNKTTAEFQVIDITKNPPVLIDSFNSLAGLNGVAYHFSKDKVFLVGNSDTQEFIIIKPQ